jgi:hypothetical protein
MRTRGHRWVFAAFQCEDTTSEGGNPWDTGGIRLAEENPPHLAFGHPLPVGARERREYARICGVNWPVRGCDDPS